MSIFQKQGENIILELVRASTSLRKIIYPVLKFLDTHTCHTFHNHAKHKHATTS